MKKLFCISLGLAITAITSCSDPKKLEEKYPEGEKGTSEAIVGEDPNLAEPRPAPIGDTAKTKEQADQFGEHNVQNVDSAARGLK
jgi:hypothetical protein